MKEINKAGVSSWLREKRVLKVLSSSNLTVTDERELTKHVESIRRRGNGACVLLVETK